MTGARTLTEEEPRSFADLAADALNVTEEVGNLERIADQGPANAADTVKPLAAELARLARQVAELAQRCDEPTDEPVPVAVFTVARKINPWRQSNGYGVTVTETPSNDTGGPSIRARVRIDAFAFQSHAVAELWTPAGWVEAVRRIPTDDSRHRTPAAFGCPSYVSRDTERAHEAVVKLARELIEEARALSA